MFAPTVGLTLRNGSGNVLPAGSGTRMLKEIVVKEPGSESGALYGVSGWWQSASRPASRYYF